MSCIEDIFKALLEDEEQKLKSLTDHNNRIRLVATVLSAYEVRMLYILLDNEYDWLLVGL